jgi:hypothetical protein
MAKRLMMITVALLLSLPSRSWAGACATGTMADYVAAGFSCQQLDKIFSAFNYASSGSGGAV